MDDGAFQEIIKDVLNRDKDEEPTIKQEIEEIEEEVEPQSVIVTRIKSEIDQDPMGRETFELVGRLDKQRGIFLWEIPRESLTQEQRMFRENTNIIQNYKKYAEGSREGNEVSRRKGKEKVKSRGGCSR
ncbi:hypothetical protein H8959_012484 [Pygathrix nigripes]